MIDIPKMEWKCMFQHCDDLSDRAGNAMEDGILATYLSLPGRCLLPCTPLENPVGELRALGWGLYIVVLAKKVLKFLCS